MYTVWFSKINFFSSKIYLNSKKSTFNVRQCLTKNAEKYRSIGYKGERFRELVNKCLVSHSYWGNILINIDNNPQKCEIKSN